jgi:hypothetical protein
MHGRAGIEKAIKRDPKTFFGYVNKKKSALATRQLYISKVFRFLMTFWIFLMNFQNEHMLMILFWCSPVHC